MEIIRLSVNQSPRERRALMQKTAAALKHGGIVVYPTETAYAVGCDATDSAAVRNIFKLKRRDPKKPLPMIVGSTADAARFARFDPLSAALARSFWPGPLTLVAPARKRIARAAASRDGEIALRVSADRFARDVARALGRPIISTSANRSGGRNPYRLADVLADLGTAPDLCLDGGALSRRAPSTIVRCDNGACEILREGPISAEAIQKSLRFCL